MLKQTKKLIYTNIILTYIYGLYTK